MKLSTTITVSLLSVLTFALTACSSAHVYEKRQGVTSSQFFQDKMYCQGGASGQSQDSTRSERLIPYDECMLKKGYKREAPAPKF